MESGEDSDSSSFSRNAPAPHTATAATAAPSATFTTALVQTSADAATQKLVVNELKETSPTDGWRLEVEEAEDEDEEGEKVGEGAFTSTTSSNDDEDLEVSSLCSLEQQLEQFRLQWRREVGEVEENGTTASRNDSMRNKEIEKEQEALFLYRQGVREEKRGNMYSAVMLYRRAVQLVPDIETKMPELREMKKNYRRRRRSASSGGSTSEQENNSETNADNPDKDGISKGQETIVEEEPALTNPKAGGLETCFTIPDSDDLGVSTSGILLEGLNCQKKSEAEEVNFNQICEPEEEVIPQGVKLVDYITEKRSKEGEKLICQPAENLEDGSTHLSQLPPEIIFYILQWVISEDCDVRSLERLSSVCRGFYLFAREKDLWRLLCQKMWTVDCKSPKILGYDSWRQMYIWRPHPLFDGVYIAKTSYVRQGDNSQGGTSYGRWQLVEYFRYIRLFSDGFMFMLTTCDDPLTTIPKIKSKTTKYPGLMTGYYRAIDCDDGKERLSAVLTRSKTTTIAPSRRQRRANVHYPDTDDKSFHMELEMLVTGKKRVQAQLQWRRFAVHSLSLTSGEISVSDFDLTSTNYPNLYFSRVKSYVAASTKPLLLQGVSPLVL